MKNGELIVNGDFNEGSWMGMDETGQLGKPWQPMNGSVIVNVSFTLYYENRPVRIKKGPGKGQIKMRNVKLTNPIEQILRFEEINT